MFRGSKRLLVLRTQVERIRSPNNLEIKGSRGPARGINDLETPVAVTLARVLTWPNAAGWAATDEPFRLAVDGLRTGGKSDYGAFICGTENKLVWIGHIGCDGRPRI